MTEAHWQMDGCELYTGDAVEVLSELPERSVQCVVTSPPYWSLRDYNVKGQVGLEDTPEEHVEHLVEIFRAARRVLRDDGTVFLNYGDAYNGHYANQRATSISVKAQHARPDIAKGSGIRANQAKPKDLLGLPWQLAFALRGDGWYLRSAIVWAKGVSFCDSYSGSVMPESVNGWRYEKQDDGTLKLRKGSWRPTTAYEHVFLLAKSKDYFADAEAVREDGLAISSGNRGWNPDRNDNNMKRQYTPSTRNPRNVWAIGTSGTNRRHFAAFPEALVEPCIQAGTPEHACGVCGAPWAPVVERGKPDMKHRKRCGADADGQYRGQGKGNPAVGQSPREVKQNILRGMNKKQVTSYAPTCEHEDESGRPVVLDPFSGTGTTLVCAIKQGCRGIGIDISQDYNDMAAKRLRSVITGVPEDRPEQAALFSERKAENE